MAANDANTDIRSHDGGNAAADEVFCLTKDGQEKGQTAESSDKGPHIKGVRWRRFWRARTITKPATEP